MANRDILLSIIVLLGIGWLFFANYNKSNTTVTNPATNAPVIQRAQPIAPTGSQAPAAPTTP